MTPAETRALIEDAARACGYQCIQYNDTLGFQVVTDAQCSIWFNPLTEIADRARMEDSLGFSVASTKRYVECYPDIRVREQLNGVCYLTETDGSRELAHNLAATRCAAAVWRAKNEVA
jgi:hypothetical protein